MMLKTQAASRRSRKSSEEEFLDACEIEEEGFIDGDVHLGKVLSTFNFGMNSAAESKDSPNEHSFHQKSSEAPIQPDCNKTSVQVNCNETFNRTKGHDSSLHTQGNALFSSQTESLASAPHGLTPPIKNPALSKEEKLAIRRQQLTCDLFLCSSNAITLGGELVNIDCVGNRVSAMTFGPQKVIIAVGVNKICRDIEEAFNRNETTAAPLNIKKLNWDNPCIKTGVCMDCHNSTRGCRVYSVIKRKPLQSNITVLVIGENLGY